MACRLVGAKPLSEPMLEYCWLTIRNKLQWNLYRNSHIFIQEIAFENVVCEMASFYLGLNVLIKPLFKLLHGWVITQHTSDMSNVLYTLLLCISMKHSSACLVLCYYTMVNIRLTLKWLGRFFFQNVISFSDAVHLMCNFFLYKTGAIQWMFSQHCGYWWPGALAPGHQ